MTFSWALEQMKAGKIVRRKMWASRAFRLTGNKLHEVWFDGITEDPTAVHQVDVRTILADDWELA